MQERERVANACLLYARHALYPGSFDVSGESALHGQRSLFILSPGDRDGLSRAAGLAGWRAIAARRTKDAAQRFLHSDAQIALVDMRDVADGASGLVDAFCPAIEAGGGALIALIDAQALGSVTALLEAGATHFLAAPFSTDQLRATLASAQRLVDRLGGGTMPSQRAQRIRRGDALFWELERGGRSLRLSDNLARHLNLDRQMISPTQFARCLPRAERRSVIAGLRGMMRSGRPESFAHAAPGRPGDRLVHHLRLIDGVVAADVEWLSDMHGDDATGRDDLTGLRSRQAALESSEADTVEIKSAGERFRVLRKCQAEIPPLEQKQAEPGHVAACWVTK